MSTPIQVSEKAPSKPKAYKSTRAAFGGGISNYGGKVTISNSSISGNESGGGAGIFNNQGNVTLSNSMVSDNIAYGDGGGIYNVNNGALTLDNSTVSGNNAIYGGGILANAGSQANITFSSIFDNVATGDGGGIAIMTYDSRKPSQVELRNALVTDNLALLKGPDIAGTLTSGGYNLIQDVSGATFISNKQHLTDVLVNAHAKLRIDSMLRENGGPTKTYALLPGSPVALRADTSLKAADVAQPLTGGRFPQAHWTHPPLPEAC